MCYNNRIKSTNSFETMLTPDKPKIKEFTLRPGENARLTLGDDLLEFRTLSGTPIAEIQLVPHWGIKVRNQSTGVTIEYPFGVICRLGTNNMPKNFFANEGKFISGDHLVLKMIEKNHDGSIRIEMRDTHSTNGTACTIKEEPQMPDNPEAPSAIKKPGHSAEQLLANNREGQITTPDGNCLAITGKGARENNEDGVFINTGIIALADGMGGESSGELASLAALEAVRDLAKNRHVPMGKFFAEACASLRQKKIPAASGSTLAIARKIQAPSGKAKFEVGHVGDSKILVISLSQKKILFESTDQSRIQEMLKRKILEDPIERYQNVQNSIISNAISGRGLKQEPELAQIEGTAGDNIVILCSDGVSDFVTPEEILELACKYRNLCPRAIMDLASSRHNRVHGFNITLNGQNRHVDVTGGDNLSVAMMMG